MTLQIRLNEMLVLGEKEKPEVWEKKLLELRANKLNSR